MGRKLENENRKLGIHPHFYSLILALSGTGELYWKIANTSQSAHFYSKTCLAISSLNSATCKWTGIASMKTGRSILTTNCPTKALRIARWLVKRTNYVFNLSFTKTLARYHITYALVGNDHQTKKEEHSTFQAGIWNGFRIGRRRLSVRVPIG